MPIEMTTSWAMLMTLGVFHGINPGMGWLFAVALGMQERHAASPSPTATVSPNGPRHPGQFRMPRVVA